MHAATTAEPVPPFEVPVGHGWWHCLATRDGEVVRFSIVPATAERPDATRVVLPEADADALVRDDASCTAHLEGPRVTRLELPRRSGPLTPALWFAEVPEPDSSPAATCLLAFIGHGVDVGTLVTEAPPGVTSEHQVAAIRWYLGTGEVDQVYVAPEHRRRGIAGAMVLAAGTLSVARSGARVWGDGQRTSDGERWRNAGPWAHRARDLTHLAPPMTPFDER